MKRKKLKEKILAHGEVSGHYHGVTVDVYEREDGVKEFDGPTVITHQEHKPITIPAKEMAAAQVVEFDHLSGMSRPVQD